MAVRVRSTDDVFRWAVNSAEYDEVSAAESDFETRVLEDEGLASAALMQVLSEIDPLHQTRMQQRLWRRHTLWRTPAVSAEHSAAQFRRARARVAQRRSGRLAVRREDAAQILSNTPLLEWVRLVPGNPLRFSLPPRAMDSQLQLLVRTSNHEPLQLAINYDDPVSYTHLTLPTIYSV